MKIELQVERLCKAFRHVETLFVQGNQVRTDQNKPSFLLTKKQVCFDQYELHYHGRIKFLHVEMPYWELLKIGYYGLKGVTMVCFTYLCQLFFEL